jgi:hypothetical protein
LERQNELVCLGGSGGSDSPGPLFGPASWCLLLIIRSDEPLYGVNRNQPLPAELMAGQLSTQDRLSDGFPAQAEKIGDLGDAEN